MKVGFVHCRIFPGGALQVFQDLIQETAFDQARIFTVVSDRDTLLIWEKKLSVTTALPSWLNNFFVFCTGKHIPLLSFLFDYRNLMFFYPVLLWYLSRKVKTYHPKKILISSFAVAKNISVPGVNTYLYLHSPMQYIWSHYDEYTQKLSGFKLKLFEWIAPKLRKRDQKPRTFDEVWANSQYTARLAKELYGLDAQVKYPQVNPLFFQASVDNNPQAYYIYVWRLTMLVKEVDRIIKLFNHFKLPLIIVWSWPDELQLKAIAGEGILFVGQMNSAAELLPLVQKSRGFINLTKESFGLWTVEALLLGVPVFGYNDGASPELVDKNSWILVDKKDMQSLIAGFEKFLHRDWDRQLISDTIKKKL